MASAAWIVCIVLTSAGLGWPCCHGMTLGHAPCRRLSGGCPLRREAVGSCDGDPPSVWPRGPRSTTAMSVTAFGDVVAEPEL